MYRRLYIALALLVLVGIWGAGRDVQAQQSSPQVTFVNASGQLVVAGADGSVRWIVTNPGERLHDPLGATWSPDGRQLFYAVQSGVNTSLRLGQIANQSVQELAQVSSGNLSGGEWLPDNTILIADTGTLNDISPAITEISNGRVVTPFALERINTPYPHSAAPDGTAIFYLSNGGYALRQFNGNVVGLPGANTGDLTNVALWSDAAPLIAYWGFADNGSSAIYVVNATSGATVQLSSGRTTPMPPVAWQPDTTNLLYRDGSGQVRAANMTCLLSSCGNNPLETGVVVLPASASDVQFHEQWVIYRDGEAVNAVNVTCAANNTCLSNAVTIGTQGAPRTFMHTANGRLVYTAYAQNSVTATDREIRVVDLTCLPNCQAQPVLSGAVAGLLSPDGAYVIADTVNNGLNIVRLSDLNMVFLTVSNGQLGANVANVRWNN